MLILKQGTLLNIILDPLNMQLWLVKILKGVERFMLIMGGLIELTELGLLIISPSQQLKLDLIFIKKMRTGAGMFVLSA